MASQTLKESIFTADPILSRDLQKALISSLWACNRDPDSGNCVDRFSAFFAYYKDQCRATERDEHAATTHQDIVDIVSHITQHFTDSKDVLRTSLYRAHPEKFQNNQGLTNSIELAARLWLMINYRSSTSTNFISLQTSIPWPETESLSNVFHNWFNTSAPQYCTSKIRFPKLLNGRDLERIGGIRIIWTDNLLDHLAINDNAVSLFCHVSVLRHIEGSTSDLNLKAFVDETIQTIALLLPRSDSDCLSLFEKRVKQSSLDKEILNLVAASREIKGYVYWHDRLLILQEVFDNTEPSSLSQWWFDRRKKVQWYTFWVAILVLLLTVVFGLVQSITGIVQAWASIKSLQST